MDSSQRPIVSWLKKKFSPSYWDAPIFFVILVHLCFAPYTKVEESFNVQAIHDLLFEKDRFDHLDFPGVVPRTFLGPLFVSTISWPFVVLAGNSKRWAFFIARLLLGILGLGAFSALRRAVCSEFGPAASGFFAILLSCQFHLPYYLSRPLPNTFALILVTLALSQWLARKRPFAVVFLFAFTTAVFRCDVLLLAAPIGIMMLLTK